MFGGSKNTRKSSIPSDKAKKYRAIASPTPSAVDPNSPAPVDALDITSPGVASPRAPSEPAVSTPNSSFYGVSPKRFSFWVKNNNHSPSRNSVSESQYSIGSPSFYGESEAGESVAQEGSQKIKYKKKLRKVASSHYMKHMADIAPGKFQSWTKSELIRLIISHGVQLRNEQKISGSTLRQYCEDLYTGKPAPTKPTLPTLFELVFQNVMARRIQQSWFLYNFAKKHKQELEMEQASMQFMNQLANSANEDFGQAELMYLSQGRTEVVGGRVAEIGGAEMSLDQEAEIQRMQSSDLDDQALERTTSKTEKKKKTLNVLDLPWTPPDLAKAKEYADYVQPRRGGKGGKKYSFCKTTTGRHCCLGGCGEQFDLWEEGQISEFSIYGPGVTNYFKFMKWGGWIFTMLTIIALPAIVLNMYGDNQSNSGLKSIARTTIGNLAPNTANTGVHIRIPGCDNFGLYDLSCYFNGDSLAMFYSSLDIAISIVIFVGYIWLTVFEKVEEKELDQSTVRTSMYSIAVSNLPKDITEDELVEHFNQFCTSKRPIAGISIAYDNVEEIQECKKRGDIIREKVHLAHQHRFTCTQLKKDKTEDVYKPLVDREREKFFDKMKKLNAELKKREEKLEQLSTRPAIPIKAFITFDRVIDRNKVYAAYNDITIYTWCCNNAHLKLKNKLLHVRNAPEPSIILWENLAYSYSNRLKRRLLTTFLSLLLVVISLIMIFSSKYLEESAANNGKSQSELCPTNFNSWTEQQQVDYIKQNKAQLYCYCDQYNIFQQATNEYCKNYYKENLSSQVLTYFASFIVLIVNNLIVRALRYSSTYEKHHTGDGKGMSIFLRLFVLKYINTAAVFLINNNNVIMKQIFGVEVDDSNEFSADWYNTVGVTIVLVQLGDVFNAHGDHIIQYFLFLWRKRQVEKDVSLALTQDELNKSQVGPEFEFAFNYAQMMSTLFVCLTFSTGIPLLYPIAAANFLLFYFVEKYLFIYLYKIPPHFNTLVGKRATMLVPFALLLHIVMSIWVLSNNTLFSNTTDAGDDAVGNNSSSYLGQMIEDKVTREATFPLFILLLVIIAVRILMIFTHRLTSFGKRVYYAVFGCFSSKTKEERIAQMNQTSANYVVTYRSAVDRKLIKGLVTYNILQNPIYKEAFGITWKNALTHKDVRAVRTFKTKADAGADEYDAAKIEELQRSMVKGSVKTSKDTKLVSKNRSFYSSFYKQDSTTFFSSEAAANAAANASLGGGSKNKKASAAEIAAANAAAAAIAAQQAQTPQQSSRQQSSQQAAPQSSGRAKHRTSNAGQTSSSSRPGSNSRSAEGGSSSRRRSSAGSNEPIVATAVAAYPPDNRNQQTPPAQNYYNSSSQGSAHHHQPRGQPTPQQQPQQPHGHHPSYQPRAQHRSSASSQSAAQAYYPGQPSPAPAAPQSRANQYARRHDTQGGYANGQVSRTDYTRRL